MSLRGEAAIVGIGETVHRLDWPGRSAWGLFAEAAKLAIEDAGLTMQDIDGIVSPGGAQMPGPTQEYIGINFLQNHYGAGLTAFGTSPGVGLMVAAAMIRAGICKCVLGAYGGQRDLSGPRGGGRERMSHSEAFGPNIATEFVTPYGALMGADNAYGYGLYAYAWLYARHLYEYGTEPEALYIQAVRQRRNALNNPRSAFRSEISVADVRNSPYVSYPLRQLEVAEPCAGGVAWIMASPEVAKACKKSPVYLLGGGMGCRDQGDQGLSQRWVNPRMVSTATTSTAKDAFRMAGYSWRDIEFAEFSDSCTILLAAALEDAGLCGMSKGDVGAFLAATNTAWNGEFPINTDGGQLGSGQLNPQGASGGQPIVEAVRQIRGEAESQVARNDLCIINLDGEGPDQTATLVLGSANAL